MAMNRDPHFFSGRRIHEQPVSPFAGVGLLATPDALIQVKASFDVIIPDFELIVDAPGGETTVECRRGCDLAWVERGVNPSSRPVPTFKFACGSQDRCSSFRIGGWMKR
jgi:hypothetical protein